MTLLNLLAALFLSQTARAGESPLATVAETSGWRKTGRYEEVVRLCPAFEKAYPGKVRCFEFGKTPEGRPMLGLAASADGALDAAAARRLNRPVLFFQAGIHAGEIEGKDAGFEALRELLTANSGLRFLSQIILVFVPVFNIDGHERFGPNNRPNQSGPEEMGWRTTAQNLNLNRDYAKADSPEMAAMLRLLGQWDPILYVDLHTTDGAEFRPDIAAIIRPSDYEDKKLGVFGDQLSASLMNRLSKRHLPLNFYPEFIQEDNPASGFRLGLAPPRFSESYWGYHNRLGMLVEVHSWKDYARRVGADRDLIWALAELAAMFGKAWVEAAKAADVADESLAGKEVALSFEATGSSRTIEFWGYAYERSTSSVSGRSVTRYDPSRPQVWKVPFYHELKPKLVVRAPKAGYLVPTVHAPWMAEKLRLHGISFTVLANGHEGTVEAFRSTETFFSKSSFEGRTQLTVKGAWAPETRNVGPGSLFIPIRQARARLIMQLLEPKAPDSFLSWGFFNAYFERKEYMEPYVEEKVALEMLAKDPAIKAEFDKKLASEPDFAGDPDKRLDFFYRRHPSFDERFGLYPIYRVDAL